MQRKDLFTNFYSIVRKLIEVLQKHIDVHKNHMPRYFQKNLFHFSLGKLSF